MTEFAEIVTFARAKVNMTDAEFDYSLSMGDGRALGALNDACYTLANYNPVTDNHAQPDDEHHRSTRADALWEEMQPQIQAMITAAQGKEYTGWSDASAGPIRYVER